MNEHRIPLPNNKFLEQMKMKNRKPVLFCSTLSLLLAASSLTAEPQVVDWSKLAPPQTVIEDPFASLSSDQLDALRLILRFEMSKDAASPSMTKADADVLRKELESEGMDVDWLFEQRVAIMEKRRAQSTAVNPEIIGQEVRIPGYVLPLDFDGLKVTEFLLVPYAGACIHTPPPPANQMVHVKFATGIKVSGLFTPVWIEGAMNALYSVQDVGFADGASRVEVGYAMSAETVELY